MKRPPLLDVLRQETRREHLLLEQHSLLRELLSPQLGRNEYCRILTVFLAFYQQIESRLVPAQQQGAIVWPAYTARVPLLRQDLADLGAAYSVVGADGSAFAGQGNKFGTAERIGVLYVLEGATQGGRLIAPAVQSSLGLTADHGARYFNLYSRQDGWGHFCRWLHELDPAATPGFDSGISAESARSTFKDLYALLARDHQETQGGSPG